MVGKWSAPGIRFYSQLACLFFFLREFLVRSAMLAFTSLILHITNCATLNVSQPYKTAMRKYNVESLLIHSIFPHASVDLLCVNTA